MRGVGMENAILVDVKCELHLHGAGHSRWKTSDSQFAEQIVLCGQFSFPFIDLYQNQTFFV
jgi:hypothetical protein